MSKISVDYYGPDGELVPEETLTAVTIGCRRALDKLGKLGGVIEAFRVIWVYHDGKIPLIPHFKIYFRNLTGNQIGAHAFTYRPNGAGGPVPSAEDVTNAMCKDGWGSLSYFITAHLKRCTEKIVKAQAELEVLKS